MASHRLAGSVRTMGSTTLEDIFGLLTLANTLQETGTQRIEAATKYYEAVYLIRTYVKRLPLTPGHAETRRLLTDKAAHYEQIAKELMNDDSSTKTLISPRSPIAKETFFTEESSVVPLPAPPPASRRFMQVQTIAAQADAALSRALDLDEQDRQTLAPGNQQQNEPANQKTIQTYMTAAELYLKAIQLAKDPSNPQSSSDDAKLRHLASTLTRRLQQTLDRIELLKSDKKLVAQDRLRLEKTTAKPGSTMRLTSEEVRILKRSSLMASGLFLPWSDEEALQLCQEVATVKQSTKSQSALYTDPDGYLRLNARQQKHFFKWARPCEIVQLRHKAGLTRSLQTIQVVQAITPYSIQQQLVTDCSFISSLCICAAFERRFGKQLVSSVLYPQHRVRDKTTGDIIIQPIVNPSGKYMIKLWLNGVARCVTIDDTLPVDKYGNLLTSVSNPDKASHPSNATCLELWVPLIEKAYMKLCGGYDFPGSNSGVDLFSLTGWIPERILFAQDPLNVRDFETAPERVWNRIFGASTFGDCLVTVSTELGTVTREEVTETGLVTGHAYAVLNVVQTKNGTRLLLLKNPWGRQEWKGKYSCYDQENWTPPLCAEVGYKPRPTAAKEDGVFWISWQDLLKHFQNFHLSWNPQLFNHQVVRHGFWAQGVAPEDDSFNVGENPQYIVYFSKECAERRPTVWILVSRHVTKQEQEGVEATDYLTVHIHRNSARKEQIWYAGKSGNCILTGAYTNNPHVLVRYDLLGSEDQYLSLILSQYKKSNDLAYTISCFCTEPFTLTRPVKELAFQTELFSQWTEAKAGGAIGSKTAFSNPQFAVAIPVGGATVQIMVTTIRTCAVCFLLFPVSSYGQPISLPAIKPVIDTGKYMHGFVVSDRQLLAHGAFTLLITNFCRGQTASFELKITSSAKLKVEEIR